MHGEEFMNTFNSPCVLLLLTGTCVHYTFTLLVAPYLIAMLVSLSCQPSDRPRDSARHKLRSPSVRWSSPLPPPDGHSPGGPTHRISTKEPRCATPAAPAYRWIRLTDLPTRIRTIPQITSS